MSQQIKVSSVVSQIIGGLGERLNTSGAKKDLANLRKSIGKNLGESAEIWPLIFENVPESFLSHNGIPTYEENAIVHALQLYALHQQSKSTSVQLKRTEDSKFQNIGSSLKILRTPDNKNAVDRRFNTMITASTYKELVYHLGHLIRLLRREESAQVDYALLSDDLFWFQVGKQEQVRLRWAQSYYYVEKPEKAEESKNE